MNKIDAVPPWAECLGWAGLLPFVALAAAVVLGPADLRGLFALALLAYGATIASFLGAIHWGLAMRGPALAKRQVFPFVWGVVPSLLAWLALLAPAAPGLVALALVLAGCFGIDRATYPDYGLQQWLPMRLALTLVAVLSCLFGAVAVLR
jgi:hypothetical protein